ncbi:cytochrome c oxidase assembly protein subunit 11 [Novimethylophilus kurashikiensis]|uniref:Cytochrome c oxidase assembly protein CtaG n=1 Tax=Novimethylophilus kurashikiensis TaxID=1825523 RepID=A0A2R5FBB9_9PROT|nr:cytochrome c oxidase assembly protein [Novimethylophilus kurashikiensis]GBG15526.1 cytochrome c oxidase assembly protein subunit 11 [Novimethylophilus kurashikiensis]
MNAEDRALANRKLVKKLLWVIAGAILFTIALVPLYNVMCQVTGFNGKTGNSAEQAAKSMKVDNTRWVTVEFTSNVMPGLAWTFYPKQTSIRVHPGQIELATYVAKNIANQEVIGQAIPSVSPGQASLYFKKIECFCFQRQTLKPGESKEMPLTFFVSPDLPKQIETITLSYAFYSAVK